MPHPSSHSSVSVSSDPGACEETACLLQDSPGPHQPASAEASRPPSSASELKAGDAEKAFFSVAAASTEAPAKAKAKAAAGPAAVSKASIDAVRDILSDIEDDEEAAGKAAAGDDDDKENDRRDVWMN